MLLNIKVEPNTVRESKLYVIDTGNSIGFPVLSIDKDSYAAGLKIESGIDFHWDKGNYNLQIGKYCALAEDVLCMIDTNHSYKALFMGKVSELEGEKKFGGKDSKPKGQIIIQNDCWIGHGATIMDGVTIHNGAVVATNAVVTKDVPPYAIVGGNPAKIIKYRFDAETIHKLEHIAWWDWDSETILKNKDKMLGDVKGFADYFYDKIGEEESISIDRMTEGKGFVYYLDMDEPFYIWKKVIRQFAEKFNGTRNELILYLSPLEKNFLEKAEQVLEDLNQYEDYSCYVNLCTEELKDDASLLQCADYYISNRHKHNVHRMCKADLYGAECLIGTANDIFLNCD